MNKVMLKDRVEFVYGFSVRVNDEPKGEFPVFGSNGATGFIDSYKVEGPGVIIGRKGSVGTVNFSEKNFTPTDTAYYLAIKDSKKDHIKFWYYYLKLLGLNKLNTHSSVPGLSREVAYLININPPDFISQKNIAEVLSILDQKIELNNKIKAELEDTAKTIFDYWFVQFDFPDKNGNPYKSSGGKMIYNDKIKREIPEGWEIGNLLDIAEYINGLPCQKYRPTNDEFLRVIKIKEMHEGFSSETEKVTPAIPEKAIIENGDVLFSWSASLELQIWSKGKGALNQHIFKVISEKYPKSFYYYQLLNYLHHFKMMAENRKTTMGHITQEHLQQSTIVLPSKEMKSLLNKCEEIISPIFSKKIACEKENQELSQLRDFLLPMLMNGQVKVK
jgi:type I restriction enzyme, S subunit